MKVAVLNDLPVAGTLSPGFGSGTELTTGKFVREGHRRGHIVDVLCPDYFNAAIAAEYDLLITKNTTKFSWEHRAIVQQHPYVNWPSDYAWNKWRLFFAFQEKDKQNPELPKWLDLFQKSQFNVFLSPLHQEAYEFVLPEIRDHENILSPPPVDADLFKPHPSGWKPDTAVCVNGLIEFKGLRLNLEWAYQHPETEVYFVGSSRDGVQLPPNAQFTGRLSWAKMAELLGQCETYFELPTTVQPANHAPVMGRLACKTVVTNKLMGAASYPWFSSRDETKKAMLEAMPRLWERLEALP